MNFADGSFDVTPAADEEAADTVESEQAPEPTDATEEAIEDVQDADETAADDAMNHKSGDETDTDDGEEYGCIYYEETFESEDDRNQHLGQFSENPVNRDDEDDDTDEPDIEPPDIDGQSKWTDWE